ncbi:hypothetical protein D9758_001773 [Tetrapyrgos nigripes]|uniref:Major facilitator superfamily (MFS) profile domain-containing protein n=1 Tax=Tetrapyrgos nigripes TaxID=182062 RepID=A0A8H5LXG8_9AGAR|nr:hypothetical protein D9758_001773 [Tetrapyrgos nigripes]
MSDSSDVPANIPTNSRSSKKGTVFWVIFITLNLALFLAALELSAISTVLPTIANALNTTDFVWIGSAYALASTAFLPLCGGLAEVFGRRPALLVSIALFAVGSAVCGASNNIAAMISGRTIQGLGASGIQSVSNIILADLVSLEERGVYATVFGLTWAISNIVGPLIGGALASGGAWRWLFYLNLPLAGIAALSTLFFMRLPTPEGRFSEKIMRLDWIGNALVMGSTTSITIALTWAGVRYPWDSYHILVPLIVGVVGLLMFMAYEAKVARYPLVSEILILFTLPTDEKNHLQVPWSVLSNRTSLSGYLQTFIAGVFAICVVYYMPVYFQACKGASAWRSGIYSLAFITSAPAAMIAGTFVKVTGRYRPQMWFGWIVTLISLGLLSSVSFETNLGKAIGFLVLMGVGIG